MINLKRYNYRLLLNKHYEPDLLEQIIKTADYISVSLKGRNNKTNTIFEYTEDKIERGKLEIYPDKSYSLVRSHHYTVSHMVFAKHPVILYFNQDNSDAYRVIFNTILYEIECSIYINYIAQVYFNGKYYPNAFERYLFADKGYDTTIFDKNGEILDDEERLGWDKDPFHIQLSDRFMKTKSARK